MVRVEISNPGLFTTIQDISGRKGMRKFGVPAGGVMDEHSAKLANWLAGNNFAAPVLEITLGGFEARFSDEIMIGLSGAQADIRIGGQSVQHNKSLRIPKGSYLKVGKVSKGCRLYLAVGGRWRIEKIMDSYSTCLPAKIGGYHGRKLRKGDVLEIEHTANNKGEREVPDKLIPHFSKHQKIRVIVGPEWNYLKNQEQLLMLGNRFGISSSSNRMGIRLQGDQPVKLESQNFRSSPVIPGIIQLPPNGEPIILMKDAQSVGGYPRILKVIDADLWRLGQVWRGNEISFSLLDRIDAIKLFHFYRNLRESLLTK